MKVYVITCHLHPEHLIETAKTAEAEGFHGCTVSDHAVYPKDLQSHYPFVGEWGAETPFPDVWVAISAMAAATSTLRLFSGIYLMAARPVLVVAKAVATAAIMSDYRVDFGFGVGWMKEDFTYLGAEFHNRGRRTDEMIEILRKAWSGEWVEYHGDHYSFEPFVIPPAPSGPIPMWGGGDADRPMRRAAHLDGWIAGDYNTLESARDKVRRLQKIRQAEGTDQRAGFGIFVGLDHPPSRDECQRLEELGVTATWASPWKMDGPSMGDPGLVAIKESLKRYAEDVVARV